MDATIANDGRRTEGRILGLISAGHFMSHVYMLTLPPLFPVLKDAFGVGYTELGLLMTLIYGMSAVTQVPVGFLVDRFGARRMLTLGLAVISIGFGLVGVAPSFWAMVALGIVAAIGHSVFHPADYALLSASISPGRMARAFSLHTFAGHLGSAATPAAMILLSEAFGWRAALLITGLVGLVILALITMQWNRLSEDAAPPPVKSATAAGPGEAPARSGLAVVLSRPMITFFLFFATLSMSSTGMQAFSVAALVALHGTTIETASAVLTVYLTCSALGILLGGEISSRTDRHALVAAIVFVVKAVMILAVAFLDLPVLVLVPMMAVMGLGQGIIRPARDMMVKAAAPKGSMGKAFGFVSGGIAAGSAIAPIPFGYLIDTGHPQGVFLLIAAFMIVALGTVAVPKTTG